MNDEVLFKDVEGALGDTAMLDWLLPIIDGSDGALADLRTLALTHGILKGLEGRELVRSAMRLGTQ